MRPSPQGAKFARRIAAALTCLIAFALLSCSCRPLTVAELDSERHGFEFEPYEVLLGDEERQTVLTGSFFGGPVRELAVVSRDASGGCQLRIHAVECAPRPPLLEVDLGAGVLFVDVAEIDGADRLLVYEPGRLRWFDPRTAAQGELLTVTSNFDPPRGDEVPHVDVTHDVNGDGRDDLVLPHVDGFWVSVQLEGGAFAAPWKVGPAFDMGRVDLAEGYRYDPWSLSRIHSMDYDRDGRVDLVHWSGERFQVHLQDERGRFAVVAESFPSPVSIDSDDPASLVAPHGVRRRRMDQQPEGALTGRVLHSLADVNGDALADLSIFSLAGGSLRRMRSSYEVHFGTLSPDGRVVFAAEVGARIDAGGIPFLLEQQDVDGDGRIEMAYLVIETGLLDIAGMLAGWFVKRTVSAPLQLHRLGGDACARRPGAALDIEMRPGGASGERAVWPSILIEDVNGDGFAELLVQDFDDELHVFLGRPGRDLFADEPRRVAFAMPHEERTWLVDIDRDGRRDLLMHHPPAADTQRVTVWIAR